MENQKKNLIRLVETDKRFDDALKLDMVKTIQTSSKEDLELIEFVLREENPLSYWTSGDEGAKSKLKTAAAVGLPAATLVVLYALFRKYGMPSEQINKVAKLIKLRKVVFPFKAGTATVVGTGVVTTTLFYGAYRNIRALFDKCTRECGVMKLNLPKRQLCMLQCKRQMLLRKIRLIRNLIEDCNKVTDPKGCREVLIVKLQKASADLKKVDDRIVKLKLETVQD